MKAGCRQRLFEEIYHADGTECACCAMCGAQERTRTFTAVKPLAPEASASTNSATWARAG
jgi:hypothetical protein